MFLSTYSATTLFLISPTFSTHVTTTYTTLRNPKGGAALTPEGI